MKTTKGGKAMNPTDAFRKEQRKKELKRNKIERKKIREVGILKKDPEQIKEQIRKLDMSKAEGALDKARKHKKRHLEDTLQMVVKKRKEYEEKMKEQGEVKTSVMFSHLPPQRRPGEEDERSKNLTPEDSVYYHPTLNPTGAPPPGKPPMYKPSIGPGIPLDGASSSGAASFSNTESEDAVIAALAPPPPMLDGSTPGSQDGNALPLPPPPPLPPNPPAPTTGLAFPPPPPGPPPSEQVSVRPPLPPPPPLPQSSQPLPPGLSGSETYSNILPSSDQTFSDRKVSAVAFIPPPPPGLPPKPVSNGSDGGPSNSNNTSSSNLQDANFSMMVAPPHLPQQHPPALLSNLQPDLLHPGMLHFPPPPPDMRPLLGLPPHGMLGHLGVPRPPYGPPPGLPPMMRPPLPPGPPPNFQDGQAMSRPYVPQKPSYTKSAAPTVVKRPLAQHTPELTSMIPASVRVRRESAVTTKPKPKTSTANSLGFTPRSITAHATPVKPVSATNTSTASKPQSIDDSYSAFLEDMKALGALDG